MGHPTNKHERVQIAIMKGLRRAKEYCRESRERIVDDVAVFPSHIGWLECFDRYAKIGRYSSIYSGLPNPRRAKHWGDKGENTLTMQERRFRDASNNLEAF